MTSSTICQAAIAALKQKGTPLNVKDIYSFIIEKQLFQFKAKDPVGILKVQIRKHCDGLNLATAKSNKYFQILDDGRYWIKGEKIPG